MRIHPRVLVIDKDYQNASSFRIENTSSKDDVLLFKIRRTEPKIATFEPREGAVAPGSHANVTVMLTELQQRSCRIVVKFVAVRRHKASGSFEQDWSRGMRRGVTKKLVEIQNAICSSSDEFSINGEDDSSLGLPAPRRSLHIRRPGLVEAAEDLSIGSSDSEMSDDANRNSRYKFRLSNQSGDDIYIGNGGSEGNNKTPSSLGYSENSFSSQPNGVSAAEDLRRSLRELTNSLQLSGPPHPSDLGSLASGGVSAPITSPPRRIDLRMSLESSERPRDSSTALDSRERQIDMRHVKVVGEAGAHIVAASENRQRVRDSSQEHASFNGAQWTRDELIYQKEMFGEALRSPSPNSRHPPLHPPSISSQVQGSASRHGEMGRFAEPWGSPVRTRSPVWDASHAASEVHQSPNAKNLRPVLRCSHWKLLAPEDFESAALSNLIDAEEPEDNAAMPHDLYKEILEAYQQLDHSKMICPVLARTDGSFPALLQLHMHGNELTDDLVREIMRIRLADMYYAKDCVFVVKISNAPLVSSLAAFHRVFETPSSETRDAVPSQPIYDDLFEKTLLRLEVTHCPYLYTIPAKIISRFSMLIHLDLSNNKIKEIKGRLGLELPNLQRLDLSHNMLSTLDKLQGLCHLKWLDASYNCIESLHNGPYMLVTLSGHLTSINLIGNKLCKFISYASEVVSLFPRLEFFDLRCISQYMSPRVLESGRSSERGRSPSRGSSPARARSSSLGSGVSPSRADQGSCGGSVSNDDASTRTRTEGNTLYSSKMRSIGRALYLEEQKRKLIRERIKRDVKETVDRMPVQNVKYPQGSTVQSGPAVFIDVAKCEGSRPPSPSTSAATPSGVIREFLRSRDGDYRDELAARSIARASTPTRSADARSSSRRGVAGSPNASARISCKPMLPKEYYLQQKSLTIPDAVETCNFSRLTHSYSVRLVEENKKRIPSPMRRNRSRNSPQSSPASNLSLTRSFSSSSGQDTPQFQPDIATPASASLSVGSHFNTDGTQSQSFGKPYNSASILKSVTFPSRAAIAYLGDEAQEDHLAGLKKSSSLDAESLGTSAISLFLKTPNNVDLNAVNVSLNTSARNGPTERNIKNGLRGISNANGPKLVVASGSKTLAGSSSLMQPPVGLLGDDKPIKPRADVTGSNPTIQAPPFDSELPSSQSLTSKSVELASMSDADIEELRSSPDQKGIKEASSPKRNAFTGFVSFYSETANELPLSNKTMASGTQQISPSPDSTVSSAKVVSIEENLVAGDDTDDEYIQWLNAQMAAADAPSNASPELTLPHASPSSPITRGASASQQPSATNPASLLSPLPMVKHPRDIARRPEQIPASPADELSPLSKIMGQITESSSKYNPWLHRHPDPAVAELL